MLYNSLRYLIYLLVILFIFACDNTSIVSQSKLQQETITIENSDILQTNNSKLRLAFSVTEFSVGTNRVRFNLIDPELGPLKSENVTVQIFYLEQGKQKSLEDTQIAHYYDWPMPGTGVYGIETTFTKPGKWGMGVSVETENTTKTSGVYFTVENQSATPELGKKIPMMDHITIDDAQNINQLTSDPNPYLAFYQTKISESVASDRRTLIVFSSPAFCKTGTCGPQLKIIKDLHPKFQKHVDFIHIEIYKNPHMLEGKIGKSDINPIVSAWNLPSEPWTFVADSSGKLTNKFEGLVTTGELVKALNTN